MKPRIDGAWRDPGRIRAAAGGTWRIAKRASIYASGNWEQFFVGADPISAIGFTPPTVNASASTVTVNGGTTASITGGLAPFTHTWSTVSYSDNIPTILNGSTASPTFRMIVPLIGDTMTAVFRDTVTDALGQTASADISASFTRI